MDEYLDILLKEKDENFDNIEHDFVRVFNTPSGKRVLKYLVNLSLGRYLPPNATNEELHYLEGQRFFISFILNMIKKGRG